MHSAVPCGAALPTTTANRPTVCGRQSQLWEFLLACAASPFTPEHQRHLAAGATEELNWSALLTLAEGHGLVPLLAERLNRISDGVPPPVREVLNRACQQNAQKTLWLTQLLLRTIELLHQKGIDALPHKGPVLAQLLYGNVTRRAYSDLDILIRPADLPRVKQVLQEAGFTPTLQFTSRQESAHIATAYEYTFDAGQARNVVELQWRVVPYFYAIDFNLAEFFARRQTVWVAEKPIATLGNEDLALTLCAHAAKHAWSQLLWIRDVAHLAQLPDLDWDKVADGAGRIGIRRIVAITFGMANSLLGTQPPAPVKRLMDKDSSVQRIGKDVCAAMQRGEEPQVEALPYFRFMAQVRERRWDRLRFRVRLATTPSLGEWSLVRLPAPLFPLYRVVRVARVARRLLRPQQRRATP